MSEFLSFVVQGEPQPQGSMKAISIPGRKFTAIVDGNPKLKRWRKTVAQVAAIAFREQLPLRTEYAGMLVPIPAMVPLELVITFYLERPASLPKRFQQHMRRPDWDKLARAVGDALTGIVYTDDNQVWKATIEKHYGLPQRTEIKVFITEDPW